MPQAFPAATASSQAFGVHAPTRFDFLIALEASHVSELIPAGHGSATRLRFVASEAGASGA